MASQSYCVLSITTHRACASCFCRDSPPFFWQIPFCRWLANIMTLLVYVLLLTYLTFSMNRADEARRWKTASVGLQSPCLHICGVDQSKLQHIMVCSGQTLCHNVRPCHHLKLRLMVFYTQNRCLQGSCDVQTVSVVLCFGSADHVAGDSVVHLGFGYTGRRAAGLGGSFLAVPG